MTYEDYLQHWGILGMKWGQRNGPPYPLSSRQMNAKERRLNDVSDEDLSRMTERAKQQREFVAARNELKKAEYEGKLTKQRAKLAAKNAKLDAKLENARKKKELKELENKNDKKNVKLDEELSLLRKKKEVRELEGSSIGNGSKFVKAMLATAGTVGITALITKVARGWGESRGQSVLDNVVNKKATDAAAAAKAAESKALKSALDKAGNIARAGEIADYSAQVNDMKNVVNYFMQNQGFDKVYKKDK